MTVFRHEMRMGRRTFVIWTTAIACFLIICILFFPQMRDQMKDVTNLFRSMGAFSAAFGMDKLNFGTMIGFYSVECGSILSIGDGFYASLLGITALGKEEKNHTAEFLLSHPILRSRVVTEKLLAVMAQLLCMNLILLAVSGILIAVIEERIPWSELLLLHAAYLLMQMELAAICFGISAFLRKSGMGIGLGLAGVFYFMNMVANISKDLDFLKYLTPYGYTEASDIVQRMTLDWEKAVIGCVVMTLGIAAAYWNYMRKDIQ